MAFSGEASAAWIPGASGFDVQHPAGERPILVASIGDTNLADLEAPCADIPALPASIATNSKYDQADSTKSTLSGAAGERDAVLQPIRNAIRLVVSHQSYLCAIDAIASWASAGALTDMQTEDAYLTRDRFMVEISMLLLEADAKGQLPPPERQVIAPWLAQISDTTIEFYRYRAGPKAKINNHRYWAGLAVGAAGYLIDNIDYRKWADRSFELGVCQVDADGHLPLELARGSQALNYHVYAARPLLAYSELSSSHGHDLAGTCGNGLGRLVAATQTGFADPAAFQSLAGKAQAPLASEKSYSLRLQLTTLGLR